MILSFDTFVRMFEILPHVPRVLVLYHGGEPLMNKELEQMIFWAKRFGVEKVVFNTNASLLNETRDLSMVDELRVSFDGASAKENDSVRVNGNFTKHADNVRKLALSYARPKVIKIYNVQKDTDKPAKYLLDYFKDCNVVFEGFQMREWARMASEPKPTNGVTFCSDLFDTFTVTSNGDVPMCCEDLLHDDIIGNVYQTPPLELWERMEERRQAFSKKSYPKLCQSCWVTTRS
jgi:radical SAM protein with 4Fe4S-binding SPASM domain